MSTLIVQGPIVAVSGTVSAIEDISSSHDPVDRQTLKITCPVEQAPVILLHTAGTLEDSAPAEVDVRIEMHNELEYMRLKEQVEAMQRALSLKIFPAGALYAFIGWLTTREEVTHQLSRYDDSSQIAGLIKQFCDMQDWPLPPDGWHKQIKEFI